jgi:hypothetical protein
MSESENYQSNKQHHRKKTDNKRGKGKKSFVDLEKNGKPDEEDQSGGFFKNGKGASGAGEDDEYKKARNRNPKAFALQSFVAAERQFRRYF